MSDSISSPYGINHTAITIAAALIVLGTAIVFRVQSGCNNNCYVQKWEKHNVAGVSTGVTIAYMTSSGNLVLSGTLVEQGAIGAGAAITQSAADARYVNTSGDTMTGALKVRANLSGSTLNVDGTTRFASGVIITMPKDIGWSVQASANQACNTTCVSACVFGEDTSVLGSFVSCSDNTADRCVCAGSN